MQKLIADISESALLEWIESSPRVQRKMLGGGYQANTYVFSDDSRRLVVKTPLGWGPASLIRRRMLQNEYRAYGCLAGMGGIPVCYGLLKNRYLVLEYVAGVPFAEARLEDPEFFFNALLQLIKEMHRKGVAHGDLKKKDNILVVDGRHPVVVDFGVAIIRKPARSRLNGYLHNLFRRFDLNAYIKLKYRKRLAEISADDSLYYHRTAVEKVAGWIKRTYLKGKKRLPLRR